MNSIELLLQGRIDSLLEQQRRARNTLRIYYRNGRWAAAKPAEQARTRAMFRNLRVQLARAAAELAAYQGRSR